MSLMDAFLLDPAPLDVWIAARTDGIVGSGTEDDPFDSTRSGPPSIAISSITFSGTTATVTTSVNHGFSTDDFVLVEGANGPDAGLYNGVFSITYVSATSFRYTMSGTPQSAAVGVLSCQLDPFTVISSITSTDTTATVATKTDHGFSPGELVLIAGVKGAGATHTDGFPDPRTQSLGVNVSGCGTLTLEENVMDVSSTSQITHSACGSVRLFANQTPAGTLIQGPAPELTIVVEDAAALVF